MVNFAMYVLLQQIQTKTEFMGLQKTCCIKQMLTRVDTIILILKRIQGKKHLKGPPQREPHCVSCIASRDVPVVSIVSDPSAARNRKLDSSRTEQARGGLCPAAGRAGVARLLQLPEERIRKPILLVPSGFWPPGCRWLWHLQSYLPPKKEGRRPKG